MSSGNNTFEGRTVNLGIGNGVHVDFKLEERGEDGMYEGKGRLPGGQKITRSICEEQVEAVLGEKASSSTGEKAVQM